MIERTAREALVRLANQFPVVGVTGPRQSGKTTLCQAVFPEKRYISLDNAGTRSIAESNPLDFINAFPEGAIIDEAQKVPGLFDALKEHVDLAPYSPGKFILTGSSQFRLRENMTESLAGRAAFLKLLPFTTKELDLAGLLPEDPYDLIFNGQYPPLYDNEKRYDRFDWYENYIETYLDLDVKEQIKDANLPTFKKFITACALRSGQLLSLDGLANDIGISHPTAKSWLNILERSFIVHLLEPDSKSLNKALVKTPKLFFVDTGLLCHLLRMETKSDLLLSESKGAIVETFAVAELLKQKLNQGRSPYLTYYRDVKGFEVDTIADWKHTFAIEVKSSNGPESKLAGNARKYAGLRNSVEGNEHTRSVVFYMGDLTMNINGTDYVSWKDWGSFLN